MHKQLTEFLNRLGLSDYSWNLILIAISFVAGVLIRVILSLFIRKKADENRTYSFFSSLGLRLGTPLNFFLPLFLFNFLLPLMRLPPDWKERLAKMVEVALIIVFSWILIRSIRVIQDVVIHRFDPHKTNNLRERRILTQLQFLRRLVTSLIIVLTIAAVLLSFQTMRTIGTGLLTGVGIGGIIIGFAAQRSLGNLLAGFQIAFTQPIRIDDEVVVEGQFGKIEEITLTYVVVRIWDDRRMILPINYFIEKHFENWTRKTSDMMGTVMLYADYSLPVEPVRQKVKELVRDHPLWDGRAASVIVSDTTDRTMQLRILVSAKSSGNVFDLRCFVREELIKFIREKYPDHLPKSRMIVDQELES